MIVPEIIRIVIAEHLPEFRNKLIQQAEEHRDYAISGRNWHARRSAEFQRGLCLNVASMAENGDIDAICADIQRCIIAVNVACKIIGISPAMRTAAICNWDDELKSRESK